MICRRPAGAAWNPSHDGASGSSYSPADRPRHDREQRGTSFPGARGQGRAARGGTQGSSVQWWA